METMRRGALRNVTLSAEEHLIEAARTKARQEQTTLNAQFRRWLRTYVGAEERAENAQRVIEELRATVKSGGRRFTRDEMNER